MRRHVGGWARAIDACVPAYVSMHACMCMRTVVQICMSICVSMCARVCEHCTYACVDLALRPARAITLQVTHPPSHTSAALHAPSESILDNKNTTNKTHQVQNHHIYAIRAHAMHAHTLTPKSTDHTTIIDHAQPVTTPWPSTAKGRWAVLAIHTW